MSNPLDRQTIIRLALGAGLLAPLLYFAMQLVAAPFYPGHNFLTHAASDLGATSFQYGNLFNVGVMTVGGLLILASIGIGVTLHHRRTPISLLAFVVVTVLASGLSTIWAGLVPLPSPDHGGHPGLTLLMVLIPVALLLALWKQRQVRPWLVMSVGLVIALIPVMSGALPLDLRSYAGLTQRILALAIFGAVGISAWYLRLPVAHEPDRVMG
jgi:hypothetical protein